MLDSLLLQDDPCRTTLICRLSIESRTIHHDSGGNEESHRTVKYVTKIWYEMYYTLV